MKTKAKVFTIETFMMACVFVIAAGVATAAGYWFWPYYAIVAGEKIPDHAFPFASPVIEWHTAEKIVLNPGKVVIAGEELHVTTDVIHYTHGKKAKRERELLGPELKEIPTEPYTTRRGPFKGVRHIVIPENLSPGTYRLRTTTRVKVSRLKTFVFSRTTEPFEVVAADDKIEEQIKEQLLPIQRELEELKK